MSWLRSRLLLIAVITLLVTSVVPLLVLGFVGLQSYQERGDDTVDESKALLDEKALNDLEARAADIAFSLASFLRSREHDLRVVATLPREVDAYLDFAQANTGEVWAVNPDTRREAHINLALYRRVAFIDPNGQEIVAVENDCLFPYPFDCELVEALILEDITEARHWTDYDWEQINTLTVDEVYVSRPIGTYVPANEAYRGGERQDRAGARFEGRIHFVMPIFQEDEKIGYVALSLDHTHVLEFTAHVDTTGRTPLVAIDPRLDNFAYMVGSDGATIAHVRHSSIAGIDRQGEPVPFIAEGDNPEAGPGNFYTMGFLSPVFPRLMDRATMVTHGIQDRYVVNENAKSLAFAVIPYHGGINYEGDLGFGLVLVTSDFEALRVSRDVLAAQIESDLDTLTAQLGGLVAIAILLVAGTTFLMGSVVVVPIRSVTRFSEIMEERALTDEEIASLRTRRGNSEVAQLARTFGGMAATVQTRGRRIEELLSQTDEALARRVQELSALDDVGRRLTATLDLNSVLTLATETMFNRMDVKCVRLEINMGADTVTIERGDTSIVESSGTQVMTVPVELEGKPVGNFRLFADRDVLGQDERRFANQLAAWVSVAVNNARLYASIEEQAVKLEEQNERILEANRLKSEFLANVSHELRTPLNAVIGFSDMMLMGISGEMSEKQTHHVTRIRENGRRLLALVNDILDLARIEAGRVDLVNKPFSTTELMDHLQSQAQVLATNHGLEFIADLDPTFPDKLVGDRQRIEQIATNLLSNAFKFTEAGAVTLRVRVNQDDDTWVLVVQDTGIGIPPHALDYIFEEFRQVDGSSTRVYQGTGLGLAITRNLVLMMNGRIGVESTLQKGSTFTVTLPMIKG